jgi:hypothetical protein
MEGQRAHEKKKCEIEETNPPTSENLTLQPVEIEVESAYEDAKAFAEQTMWVGVNSPIDTIRTALDLVGLAPSDTLLDLGCGDGRLATATDAKDAFEPGRLFLFPKKVGKIL